MGNLDGDITNEFHASDGTPLLHVDTEPEIDLHMKEYCECLVILYLPCGTVCINY